MLRIVGGSLSGRRLAAPPGRHTRPTADKVREAIFNTVATLLALDGVQALDLFAGSGALGIEALSRGAAACTFVESHARTAAGIRGNLERLGISRAVGRVVTARAEAWLLHADNHRTEKHRTELRQTEPHRTGLLQTEPPAPAALVLADPPYAFEGHDALLAALAVCPQVAAEALIVLETARGQALTVPPRLELVRTKGYGETQVSYLIKHLDSIAAPAEPPE